MRLLFIHQNFPGQYRNIAPALQQQGHQVVALGCRRFVPPPGLQYHSYAPPDAQAVETVSPDQDLNRCLARAERVADLAYRLREEGFSPDAICYHSGWGEGLYLRDIWPQAALLCYPELYARPRLMGYGFDPLVGQPQPAILQALRRQNFVALSAIADSDVAIAPTQFQISTFPPQLRNHFQRIHEGVDIRLARPNPRRIIQLASGLQLSRDNKVITFATRNLEPLRGLATFMRAIPHIQQRHPDAYILLAGGNGSSYGPPPPDEAGWKQVYLRELQGQLDLSRIHFLGPIPYEYLLGLFQISSCHCYLTYPYALSWSMLEAMSCGALIIGSRCEPVQEVIRHGENGLLADFANPEQLAEAVIEALDRRESMRSLRAAARQTVLEQYRLDEAVHRYEMLCADLASRQRPYPL